MVVGNYCFVPVVNRIITRYNNIYIGRFYFCNFALMNYPSKLIENAVNEFKKLPGIGEKTALRLVLKLLKMKNEEVANFGNAMISLKNEIKTCTECHNYADFDVCEICSQPLRDETTICVVENIRDVIALESTGIFKGKYHVLGGIISPINGVGPEDLTLESLFERIDNNPEINELIMALNPNMEGDTTVFYISRKLQEKNIKITALARGVSFGGELEYTDELTLARSLASRMPFENYLVNK